MKRLLLASTIVCSLLLHADAQTGPPTTVGGMTVEKCLPLTVTASSAYTAGNEVGQLIQLTPFRSAAQGAPDQGGVVQSVRLDFKDIQTVGFKAYEFSTNPTNSTWGDKTSPAIAAGDVFFVLPPLIISNNDSGLGTHTVYGTDAIARIHISASQSDYWILVTTGTPTFGSPNDVQFCATYLVD